MKKAVVYTILIGGYDLLNTPVKYDDTIKYICFTDVSDLKSDVWEIREYPKISVKNNRIKSRFLKLCPHKVLQEYDMSMYIDANMVLQEIPDVPKILENNKIAVKIHNGRNNIYDEALVCIRSKLDTAEIVNNQIETYKQEGIDVRNTGLFDCGMIFRRHNDPELCKLGEEWWKHLCNYSCRDQLSFPVVYLNYPIRKFPRNEFDKLLKRRKHAKRSF